MELFAHEFTRFQIRGTTSPESQKMSMHITQLFQNLSFSHFAGLIETNDPLKRIFYETKYIKSAWSIRELKRQINRLYFERMGLSNNPEKMCMLVLISENAYFC